MKRTLPAVLAVAVASCSSSSSITTAENPPVVTLAPATPAPTPTPTPAPTPTPTPTPTPFVPGPSDVAYLLLLNYVKCEPGRSFIMTRGCRELYITATPKNGSGNDARQHGRNLRWWVNGKQVKDTDQGLNVGCVYMSAGPGEDTFNRLISRIDNEPCEAYLEVELTDPAGNVHSADRVIVVE